MTADVIEGEATEVDEPRSLVVRDQGMAATGALALAALDDDEFDRRLSALTKGIARVERIQKALMTRDVDYGVIPNTSKPTLLKPGAEMLCQAYSLAGDFTPKRTIGDGESAPHLSYLTRCDLHLGSLDGPIVAVGYGAANSWEKRYRYRKADRICPNCGKPAVIKGAEQYGGGWLCWKKKDGCGTKWPDGAEAIEGQVAGEVENPDPFDLDVVLAKMAEKRAHVDATLRATNASRLFTQDLEDLARPPEGDHKPEQERATGSEGLIGKIATSGTSDFNLRQTPDDDWRLPFRIKEGNKVGQIVLAEGQMALDLEAMREKVMGTLVTVWGTYTDEKSPPKADGFVVVTKVLHLTRIKGADWELPREREATVDDDLSDLDF